MGLYGKDLYVAFRGTEIEKPGDILTDLDIAMVSDETWSNVDIKFHKGFLERAKDCLEDNLISKITEFNPKRVIFTGHSMGAAISALIYINFVKEQEKGQLPYELYNVTFGCPMFGNQALKNYIFQHGVQFGKMYHFVKKQDIVPGKVIIHKSRGEQCLWHRNQDLDWFLAGWQY